MINPNRALLDHLETAALHAVACAIPRPPHLALLDFPAYSNVGDSAIYLGQLALFERLWGLRPAFVSVQSEAELGLIPALIGDAPVFLNGGGNFGDLWPAHQRYREAVLHRLRDRTVIQLPQSIHFDSPTARDRAARAIEAHGRFVLFVRDTASLAIARAHFACETVLCPDMAFLLGPLPRAGAASRPSVAVMRSDHEAIAHAARPNAVDWTPPMRSFPGARRGWSALLSASPLLARQVMPGRIRRFHAHATRRLDAGIALLSGGEHVVTDRLHGHVLCLLLGIPHTVIDNRSGKTAALIETWTRAGLFDLAEQRPCG